MTPSELPSPTGNNPLNAPEAGDGGGVLNLTPEQLEALGLQDCQPGDSYTIKITKADSADGNDAFTVDDVSEGGDETGDETGQSAAEPPEPDSEGVEGEGVAPDDKGAAPLEDANAGSNGAEEKVLGVARRKKSPRAGLPDTKKMRDM